MTLPPAHQASPWAVLAHALTERRTVRARYHGHERLLCPHVLGWKNGRRKLLAYQVGGTTSGGVLPPHREQRWRSLFVDEIEDAVIVWDYPWESADNYSSQSNCVDQVRLEIPPPRRPAALTERYWD
jgi:hypothetical protein